MLWSVPRLQPATGTLVVIVAGRTASSLPATTLSLGRGSETWSAVGTVTGDVPAAPSEQQLLAVAVQAGRYSAIRLGADSAPVSITMTAGQVEPLLLGIDAGHLIPGAVYAGNDDVNLGLGELGGRFVPLPAFDLVQMNGSPFNLSAIAGHDVVIAAFHTTCHETCPLYTALFLQLQKRIEQPVMLVEVTTDPTVDTPAVLTRYGSQVGARWIMATGTPDQVASFWKTFAVELAGGDTHTSTLALVDRHGYVRLVYRGVPNVGHEIPPSVVTSLSTKGLAELASGGDGWGAPDVLQALGTISGPETRQASAGGKAPAFTLLATDGSMVRLTDVAGRPLVINFWATYCPPCKAEMPLLAKDVSASNARLVLINEGESVDKAKAFLAGVGLRQPSLLDQDLAVGRAYGMSALPLTIFVRADGTIDRRQVGEIDERVLASELSILASQ